MCSTKRSVQKKHINDQSIVGDYCFLCSKKQHLYFRCEMHKKTHAATRLFKIANQFKTAQVTHATNPWSHNSDYVNHANDQQICVTLINTSRVVAAFNSRCCKSEYTFQQAMSPRLLQGSLQQSPPCRNAQHLNGFIALFGFSWMLASKPKVLIDASWIAGCGAEDTSAGLIAELKSEIWKPDFKMSWFCIALTAAVTQSVLNARRAFLRFGILSQSAGFKAEREFLSAICFSFSTSAFAW